MEISRNTIMEIVNKCNLKPDKDYGQNFLIEPEICKKIVNFLDIKEQDNVLEIGPGLGSLTNHLVNTNARITAVDIDTRMIDFLKLSLHDAKNLTLINSDIRKFDISKYNKVIGNLPYNITTETIIYILKTSSNIERIILMCQSETYPHFSDIEGKEYGPTSVLLHLIGDCKKLISVKAGSFYPVPKCQSTVFEILINKDADFTLAIEVFNFSKALFANRRKTIFNNLSNLIKDKEKAANILKCSGLEPNLRPEQIKPLQFKEVYSLMVSAINL